MTKWLPNWQWRISLSRRKRRVEVNERSTTTYRIGHRARWLISEILDFFSVDIRRRGCSARKSRDCCLLHLTKLLLRPVSNTIEMNIHVARLIGDLNYSLSIILSGRAVEAYGQTKYRGTDGKCSYFTRLGETVSSSTEGTIEHTDRERCGWLTCPTNHRRQLVSVDWAEWFRAGPVRWVDVLPGRCYRTQRPSQRLKTFDLEEIFVKSSYWPGRGRTTAGVRLLLSAEFMERNVKSSRERICLKKNRTSVVPVQPIEGIELRIKVKMDGFHDS